MTLVQWLTLLANGGGSSAIVAWIISQIPAFNKLTQQQQQMIYIGATILVSIIAYCVITFVPTGTLSQLTPIFEIIYSVFAAVFAGKAFMYVKTFTARLK